MATLAVAVTAASAAVVVALKDDLKIQLWFCVPLKWAFRLIDNVILYFFIYLPCEI